MTKIAISRMMPRPRVESWNACAVPWKLVAMRRRQLGERGLLDLRHGVAQRHARPQVERDGHRRQLAGVVDRQRADAGLDTGQARERNPARRSAVRTCSRFSAEASRWILRRDAHDDLVGVVRRVDLRDLPRAERAEHRAFDLVGRQAEGGDALAIERDVDLRVGRAAGRSRRPAGRAGRAAPSRASSPTRRAFRCRRSAA